MHPLLPSFAGKGFPSAANRHDRRRVRAQLRQQAPKLAQPGNRSAAAPAAAVKIGAPSHSRRRIRGGQDDTPPMQQMGPKCSPIASNTTFGALTDISMGWDGTLWGIDAQGAPHVYDAINDVWVQHGSGIDAVAGMYGGGSAAAYVFMGSAVIAFSPELQAGAPQPIGGVWPNLPASFKLGVVGAASLMQSPGQLLLVNGGRYVSTDNSVQAGKLTQLPGWPQSADWAEGIVDCVFQSGLRYINLVRNGNGVVVDTLEMRVVEGPVPLDKLIDTQTLPASWAMGFDAGAMVQPASGSPSFWVFNGTAVGVIADDGSSPPPTQIIYLGNLASNWPATWHPVLRHAPNGRDGNLWSVMPTTQGSYIVHHDGETWSVRTEQADHVGVGQDDTVMLASAQKLWTFNGTGFAPVSPANNLIQVSLGNADLVFARDSNNNVYSFSAGTLTQDTGLSAVVHIAASNDGTLWHAISGDPDMHRQLVNSGADPEAISVGGSGVNSVSKVAATGFGAAHCLAQDGQGNTQAYRYDSPYVFKTGTKYDVGSWSASSLAIEQGAGQLFFNDFVLISDNPLKFQTRLVTIDAHTGAEVAATPWLTGSLSYGQPVFDSVFNLIYVATSPQADEIDPTPGQLLALDARTLAVKWSFTAAAGIDAAPALNRTRLCVSDRSGKLYMFDTAAALANPSAVQPKWVVSAATSTADTHRIATPVFVGDVEDLIYTAVWDCSHDDATGNWTTQGTWVSYLVPDGTPNDRVSLHTATGNFQLSTALTAPAYGKLNIATASTPQLSPAIFYGCYDAVIAVGAGPTTHTFSLPAGDWVNTGFACDAKANCVWFGSYNGTLYCLDTNLDTVNNTPFTPAQQSDIYTTPVLYKDTQGGTTVIFGVDTQYDLLGFDPANGNVVALPTGATRVYTLSRSVTNGVIYVGGSNNGAVAPGQYPQVFGMRVDQLPQAESAFVIESQLLQDPDPSGTGNIPANGPLPANPIPPSVARYQTHLTVVDDQKNPLPNTTVKIWADVADTVITVDGQQYTVGPDDAAYATATTGHDGCVVIVSDAVNINASALRVWASFMNPFERIIVYPDHEWHGRAASSDADASADPNRPDPTKPNLSTAYRYDGTQLFSDAEKSQGAPTNVANAVSQMNSGLKPGGSSSAALAGALKTVHGADPTAPYVAYDDLGGMHYGPNNARVTRPATVYAPFGFSLSRPNEGTHTYTPMSHSDARDAIDQLSGASWVNPAAASRTAASAGPVTFTVRLGDDPFVDFWNWLVGEINQAVSAIENVIVSVADDIVVGIRFLCEGVETVFRAVIKVIDDVANAIGSFFVQLLKAIEDVIEALSVLFHFGEIIWTHNWLKQQFNTLQGDLQSVITTKVQTILSNAVANAENNIAPTFESFKNALGINDQVTSVPGSGSTPHSAYTVNGSSCSVQASWGTQHLKSGLSSGGGSSSAGPLLRAGAGTPSARRGGDQAAAETLEEFLTGVWTSIASGAGADAFDKLKSDAAAAFTAQSPKEFFDALLSALVDTIELLVTDAVSIAGNLAVGICGFVDEVVSTIVSALNYAIDIPPFTQLYKLLFDEDLTLLNVATLVVAIPVTIVFRLVEQQYPSQVLQPLTAAFPTRTAALASPAAPVPAQKACLITNGVLSMAYGLVSAASDNPKGELPGWLGALSAGLSTVMAAFSAPWIYSDSADISDFDWEPWGFDVAFVLVTIAQLKYPAADEDAPFVNGIEGAFLLFWNIFQFVEDKKTDLGTDLGFANSLFSAVPELVNPIKLVPDYGTVIAATIDIVGYLCSAFLYFVQAAALTSEQARADRPGL